MADTFARMKQLVGTTAEWAANDIVLGEGEIGVERIGVSDHRAKCGDGVKKWSNLPYLSGTAAAVDAQVAVASAHAATATTQAVIATTKASEASASQSAAAASQASASASQSAASTSAAIALDAADDAASFAGYRDFDSLASLLANTSLTYSGSTSNTVQVGQVIRLRNTGFIYGVLASNSTSADFTTAGGVKLRVLPNANGYHARAFGAVGDNVVDDTAALQKFFDFAAANAGKYLTFDWSGSYNISSTLEINGDGNTYISGEVYCTADMNVAIRINGRYARHIGYITVYGNTVGTNLTLYANRRVAKACVDVESCFNTKFDGFYVQGSRRDGVRCLSNNTPQLTTFTGNGSQSAFNFSFRAFAATDLLVQTTVSGVTTTLQSPNGYTVTFNANQASNPGGTVTLVAGALANGATLNVSRALANSISAVLGKVTAWNCGSGGWIASDTDTPRDWNVSFGFSGRTDTGASGIASGATAQRSVLNVSSIPSDLDVEDVLRLGKQFHVVKAIDRTAGTISVYPWIWDGSSAYGTVTSGTFFSCHGAGLNISGNNTTGMIVEGVQGLRCGILLYCNALYGPLIRGLEAEVCCVALGLYSLNIGLSVTGFHPEVAEDTAKGLLIIDYLEPRGVTIAGINVPRPKDIEIMVPSTNASPVEKVWKSFTGVTFLDGAGGAVNSQGRAFGTAGLNAFTLSNVPGNDFIVTTRGAIGSETVATLTYDANYDRLFGRKVVTIYQATINASGGGQSLKIKPSTSDFAAGITVMGVSSGDGTYTIPASTNARKVEAVYEPDNKRWQVVVATWDETLKASATWNPDAIADKASKSTTVTVTGAALGDYVDASFSLDLQGLTLSAYVSAADTVKAVLSNLTGGVDDINLGSGTLRLKITKP